MPKLIRSDNRSFSTFLIHAGAGGVGSIAIQLATKISFTTCEEVLEHRFSIQDRGE